MSEKTYAIHPALGVARLGNADADPADPSSYYLGAESQYQVPNAGKPYKTASGQIKKQAQRFRIYEFEGGTATREITLGESDVASIEWTVHLQNRKAALNTSEPRGSLSLPAALPPKPWGLDAQPEDNADPHYWPATTRNEEVPSSERSNLCIDPGPQSVGGDVTQAELSGNIAFLFEGKPKPKTVYLGKLALEGGSGRLLVFAGYGNAEGLDAQGQYSQLPELKQWVNNTRWYDDTADGPVSAVITFKDGTRISVDDPNQRAWVICAAPRYAPAMDWITTIYDVAFNAVRKPDAEIPRPSFAKDIYPVIRCTGQLPWLSVRASWHGTDSGNVLKAQRLKLLGSNDPSTSSDAYNARAGVFSRLRNPNEQPIDRESVQKSMPQVSGEVKRDKQGDFDVGALTPLQYALFQKWRDGDFEPDQPEEFVALEDLDVARQPAALDRAALEGSAGTPFYPGIESWRILRAPELYANSQPLRMSAETQPGDLTIGNALPWQADFLDCNDVWWPVQRPNEVTRNGKNSQPWVPTSWIPTEDEADYNKMVEGWWQLGFIVPTKNGSQYEEVEGSADHEGDPIT